MTRPAIEYEVTLQVDAAIAADFLAWLRGHVEEMLALPGFSRADLLDMELDDRGRRGYCVRYRLHGREALETYFRDHAARMREEGVRRFGDAFRASRRVLSPI